MYPSDQAWRMIIDWFIGFMDISLAGAVCKWPYVVLYTDDLILQTQTPHPLGAVVGLVVRFAASARFHALHVNRLGAVVLETLNGQVEVSIGNSSSQRCVVSSNK